ncbi:YhdP family protein [Thaumasiovibrio subtropicus]|uniref:YhdP family protein n=1 Tax=Thaumasiovibrio subtropicus TaxID=1891207 RepID=UPI000B3613C7|nr:YhdP family protein [Thaumasiovibrio subtropicus]
MVSIPVRLLRGVMWLLLTLLVVAALLITTLRFVLPQLNQFNEPINLWLSKQSQVYIETESLEGTWAMRGPDLRIHDLTITQPGYDTPLLSIDDASMRLDLWRSFLQFKPVFADVTLRSVDLDLTQIPELDPAFRMRQRQTSGPTLAPQRDNIQYQLEQLFFVQLEQFLIKDSYVTLFAPSGEPQRLYLPALKWLNQKGTHLAEGQVSLADAPDTVVNLRGNITKPRVGFALSGTVYTDASNIKITPWLSSWMSEHVSLLESEISFQSWFNFSAGEIDNAQLILEESHFVWAEADDPQRLDILNGQFYLRPDHDGWTIRSQRLNIDTNGVRWPDLAFRSDIGPGFWYINLAEIEMETLRPLHSLFPAAEPYLTALNFGGSISDIRFGWTKENGFAYSADIADLSMSQWELLPEVHKLHAHVRGDEQSGFAQVTLQEDTLPYGPVFQAPLTITDAAVNVFWAYDDTGWRLWSDDVAVQTPHLNARGEFRLDFPANAPAWLSYYAEADVLDAAHTWRYLPTLALGESLTDYLSGAIQGGHAQQGKLLWYGDLQDFPYTDQSGIFQVDVTLKEALYEFYPEWPTLQNADIRLLFENASLFLSAASAETRGASASNIDGVIADLSSDGHLDIRLDLATDGKAVRDYMAHSPLENIVGVALDYVQPYGKVKGDLALHIPFDDRDIGVDGSVRFSGNPIHIKAPELVVEDVTGRLIFDADRIEVSGVTGRLFDQPVTFSAKGATDAQDIYQVDIDLHGNWHAETLASAAPFTLLSYLEGAFPWQGKVSVAIDDEVEYRVDMAAKLDHLNASLPYPFDWQRGDSRPLSISVQGNNDGLQARASLPDAKHQVAMRFPDGEPQVTASYLGIGDANWLKTPLSHHSLAIKAKHIDADAWLEILTGDSAPTSDGLPWPTRVNVEVARMKLATMDWHDVSLALRRHPARWHALINSREVNGSVNWPDGKPMDVNLEEAYFNFAVLQEDGSIERRAYEPNPVAPLAGELELALMNYMPDIDLYIGSSWLQGYRLGEVSARLRRENRTLLLQQLEIHSGETYLSLDGHWTLRGNRSESQLVFEVEGQNSSDLMGRFSTSGGLENASFNTYVAVEWQGAPWQLHRESMNGEIRTRMGKGIIAQVGGAGRLLGLFSLESILRKMQLDFSGVFDDGLPFNYLTGSGQLENGILTTDDIEMETLAGDLRISGTADLTREWVDAQVRFSPDFTSGLPTLTAFAVAPQSALLVFAVSTILSPVVDVFTQINYQIEGPIDEPMVIERSRSRGEVQLKSKDEE